MTGDRGRRGLIFEAQQERCKNLAVAIFDRGWAAQSNLGRDQSGLERLSHDKGVDRQHDAVSMERGNQLVVSGAIQEQTRNQDEGNRRLVGVSKVGSIQNPTGKEMGNQQGKRPLT